MNDQKQHLDHTTLRCPFKAVLSHSPIPKGYIPIIRENKTMYWPTPHEGNNPITWCIPEELVGESGKSAEDNRKKYVWGINETSKSR